MDPAMVPLNRSLDVDLRIWRQDIRVSLAWVSALAGADVLTVTEGEALREGLTAVAKRLETEPLSNAPEEDIHTLVERLLYEEVGPVAGKLQTGRSRNDQVSTGFRLWGIENARELDRLLDDLTTELKNLAANHQDLVMPGYTHLQQAQPIRAAHWALSHFWALTRDRTRLRRAARSAAVLPLGAGAVAGCPFPVDREAIRIDLGFLEVSRNSVDAVGDRDWVAEMAFAAALIGAHLSRLAEDLVLFSSVEFGFVRLGDGFSTGSSLMPQKRNPDVAELVRGKAGRLLGNLMAILTLLKGLPTGYNRDLQEDKEILFDSVDTLLLTLPAISGAIGTLEFREDRIASALDSQLLATDLADHLVRRGVPFRESHEVVGRLVRRAEEEGCDLTELPAQALQEAHATFNPDVLSHLTWVASVDARDLPGGTGQSAVRAQLKEAEELLSELRGSWI
ncbi:MAG: argininosuccinate lyase [Gemmatimonadetes bacterium]|nr:argininosuccinate lyase [Gemmatimonadota bacterium]